VEHQKYMGRVWVGSGAGSSSGAAQVSASVLPGDDSLWEQKPAQEATATTEEDFDQYFEGLFM
jgi:hypothetical protein